MRGGPLAGKNVRSAASNLQIYESWTWLLIFLPRFVYHRMGICFPTYNEMYFEGADISQGFRGWLLHFVHNMYVGDNPTALKAQTDRLARNAQILLSEEPTTSETSMLIVYDCSYRLVSISCFCDVSTIRIDTFST
jgi:hypothetical protein